MNKCLIFFLEGPTETAFYKKVVSTLHEMHPQKRFDCSIEFKTFNGVDDFKKGVKRYLKKKMLPRVSNLQIK